MNSPDTTMVDRKDLLLRHIDGKFTFQKCYNEKPSTRVAIKQQAVDDALEHIEDIVRKFRVGIAGVHENERDAFDMMGGDEVRAWLEEIGEYFSSGSNTASFLAPSHDGIGRQGTHGSLG